MAIMREDHLLGAGCTIWNLNRGSRHHADWLWPFISTHTQALCVSHVFTDSPRPRFWIQISYLLTLKIRAGNNKIVIHAECIRDGDRHLNSQHWATLLFSSRLRLFTFGQNSWVSRSVNLNQNTNHPYNAPNSRCLLLKWSVGFVIVIKSWSNVCWQLCQNL